MSEKIDALIKAIYEPTPQGTGWSDHVARSAKAAYKDLMAAQRRLAHLDQWIESRGLPKNWQGPLDAMGWVLTPYLNRDGIPRAYCAAMSKTEAWEHFKEQGHNPRCHSQIRQWDWISDEQRAAALAIRSGEGERNE